MRTLARRSKAARRTRQLAGMGRPLLLLTLSFVLLWVAVSAGLPQALREGVRPDRLWTPERAVALLQWQTGRVALPEPDAASLLSLASPLLAANPPDMVPDAAPPDPVNLSEPPAAQPPPLVVSTPVPSPDATPSDVPATPDAPPVAETGAPLVSALALDDRVWYIPSATDPGSAEVRDVTLLPGSTSPGQSVYVNNNTKYSYDIGAALAAETPLTAVDGPQILIIHTHGTESFLPDERDYYIPSDIERTEDTRYNVIRLGDEIAERLGAMGLTVLHDREIYDYPSYNGSYGRTLRSIKDYMAEYPGLQMVLDIHRDAIGSIGGVMYKAVSQTDAGKAAQMMFVVGTDANGLVHDSWRQNLSVAAKLQQAVLARFPTLMRPINLRSDRFNQHATPGSLILEVGTAANSLNEAILAAQLFCDSAGPLLCEWLLPIDNGD